MRPLLALLVLAVPLSAQEIGPKELRERLEQGRPLWEVAWKLDEDGELWMSPDPFSGGEWGRAFPEDDGGLQSGVANLGALGNLNMLLHGPRDLASLAEAETLLRMVGADTATGALRHRIVTPVTEENPAMARRAALERILAVRLVQERCVTEARPELQAVARDAEADPFLRRAAQDALHALDGVVLPPSVVPAEVLAAVPEEADLVFFVDQARVPPAFFLPRLAREAGMHVTYLALLEAGGPVSPAWLAGGQRLVEVVSLLPFELARRFGNARMDWTVGAVKIGDWRVAFWIEAGGLFEYAHIAKSLREGGFGVEEEDGMLRADGLPFGNALELGAHRLRVHGLDFTGEPDPERAVALRKAGLGDAPVWVHVPAGSRIFEELPLPAMPKSATLTVTFDDGIVLRLRSEHDDKVHAQAVASLLGGLRRQAERALEDLEPAPEMEKALGILRGAMLKAEGEVFSATVRIRGVTPEEVLALFRSLWLR